MALTKIKVNNLDTGVTNMVQNMVTDNSVDSADVTLIVNSNIAAKSTSDLSEGTNLYYTDTRTNSAIDARVDKAFVDALNVNADTLDSLDSTQFTRKDVLNVQTGIIQMYAPLSLMATNAPKNWSFQNQKIR